MKPKPILFNTDMVRATLDNRKTVTRRAVKPQPVNVMTEEERRDRALSGADPYGFCVGTLDTELLKNAPYRTGDILYVRETWAQMRCFDCPSEDCEANIDRSGLTISCDNGVYIYRATDLVNTPNKWRPSIHMPREAARIFLRVTDVRVERLNDITERGAQYEGVSLLLAAQKDPEYAEYIGGYYNAFADLWDSIVKLADRALYGWDANPWVWVIEFERCEKPDGWHALNT